ncbi:hypothetical protein YC2023_019196 [Brassica napus]
MTLWRKQERYFPNAQLVIKEPQVHQTELKMSQIAFAYLQANESSTYTHGNGVIEDPYMRRVPVCKGLARMVVGPYLVYVTISVDSPFLIKILRLWRNYNKESANTIEMGRYAKQVYDYSMSNMPTMIICVSSLLSGKVLTPYLAGGIQSKFYSTQHGFG